MPINELPCAENEKAGPEKEIVRYDALPELPKRFLIKVKSDPLFFSFLSLKKNPWGKLIPEYDD